MEDQCRVLIKVMKSNKTFIYLISAGCVVFVAFTRPNIEEELRLPFLLSFSLALLLNLKEIAYFSRFVCLARVFLFSF